MRFAENVADGVRLDVPVLRSSEDHLALRYVVANDSDWPVWLVNGLFHRRGAAGFEVDPNLAYCHVANDVLLLRKQLVEVPEDLDVEAPEVPYLSRLDAGEEFAEDLRIPFPVEPRDPYHPQPRASEPYWVNHVTFALGYVVDDDPIEPSRVTLAGGRQAWWASYSQLVTRQRIKTVGPREARVLVAISAGD
jgi:hypothetical protein